MKHLEIKTRYPNNPNYTFETRLERLDLDKEREKDLISANGFIVSPTNGIKKDLKDENSIFSSKFGNNLSDLNQFANRFRCNCGMTYGKANLNLVCKHCGFKVKFIEDNPKYFGWLVIKSDEYFIMHPNIYRSIEFFIGKEFPDIIKREVTTDEDGHEFVNTKEDQPYYGIGMTEFKNRFDEIMKYYLINKSSTKRQYYEDIMANRDKIFIQSIPVFSTILRPFNEDQDSFYFEESNAIYTKLNRLVTELNDSKTKISRKKKSNEELLYNIQCSYMDLYNNIVEILAGKKGIIRSLFSGRYNFTSRDVIVSNPKLRIDEVILPYQMLIEILQLSIINILKTTYNLSYQDAYNTWYKAKIEKDPIVVRIINSIIHHNKRGFPVVINRNPTIQYGSILQMYCVGMTDAFTMEIPLQILAILAADWTKKSGSLI